MAKMRAKMKVSEVIIREGHEELKMVPVCKTGSYPEDGADEDNTYAKWTPSGELKLGITNPALHGQFKPGQKFYVDFTDAE